MLFRRADLIPHDHLADHFLWPDHTLIPFDDTASRAVADARCHGYTWNRIAERLGTTIPAARHRYAEYARCRRQLDLFA